MYESGERVNGSSPVSIGGGSLLLIILEQIEDCRKDGESRGVMEIYLKERTILVGEGFLVVGKKGVKFWKVSHTTI